MKFEKLRKNQEFRNVYRKGKSYSDENLVLYKLQNRRNRITDSKTGIELEYNRVGISVSKKVGKSVVRSRVKRLIYEAHRLNKESINNGFDIVFLARNNINGKDYKTVEKSVIKLYKKSGLLKNEKISY